MKIVALVPFWEQYENNEFRVKKISGRYMLSYTLEKLNRIEGLDEIVVYSSSDSFRRYIEPNIHYSYMPRPVALDSADTTIEMIIESFLSEVDADVVLLLHPTSPLLRVSSIQSCLDSVCSGGYDSAFSAVRYSKFAWYDAKPVNYSLDDDIPTPSSVKPIHIEQASLYVFSQESFVKQGHRVAGKIYISQIDQIEGLEVRNSLDADLVELIINSGMYSEGIS